MIYEHTGREIESPLDALEVTVPIGEQLVGKYAVVVFDNNRHSLSYDRFISGVFTSCARAIQEVKGMTKGGKRVFCVMKCEEVICGPEFQDGGSSQKQMVTITPDGLISFGLTDMEMMSESSLQNSSRRSLNSSMTSWTVSPGMSLQTKRRCGIVSPRCGL